MFRKKLAERYKLFSCANENSTNCALPELTGRFQGNTIIDTSRFIIPPFTVRWLFPKRKLPLHGKEDKGVDCLLDDLAIKAIESAMQDGCTVEVKLENGNIVVVQKREKRTVTYRGLAKS